MGHVRDASSRVHPFPRLEDFHIGLEPGRDRLRGDNASERIHRHSDIFRVGISGRGGLGVHVDEFDDGNHAGGMGATGNRGQYKYGHRHGNVGKSNGVDRHQLYCHSRASQLHAIGIHFKVHAGPEPRRDAGSKRGTGEWIFGLGKLHGFRISQRPELYVPAGEFDDGSDAGDLRADGNEGGELHDHGDGDVGEYNGFDYVHAGYLVTAF
jgi:hypothetical protein